MVPCVGKDILNCAGAGIKIDCICDLAEWLVAFLEDLFHNKMVLTVCFLLWMPKLRKVFYRSILKRFVPDALCCSWLDMKHPASFPSVGTSKDSSNKLIFLCLIMMNS